ncbi:hypothetical protein RRG08_065346 [Elysia crispata]|uniref:Fibrinogen C-terminal domain-containing protein n=1 Tax=Elysia crispata TaxID=231223 RepID=A0AAE1AH05_9GAST|nr:hypothetical protein RRG08_065346 [Elysia crispata]
MRNALPVLCCLLIATIVRGLELTFELGTPPSSSPHAACGVLKCEESLAANQRGSGGQKRTIFSLRIFKHTQHTPALRQEGNNGDSFSPLASLTLSQRNVSSVSDGVKVDGFLEPEQASFRVKIFKSIDCSATYSCEVRTSDGQGDELVQVNRLYQRSGHEEGQTGASLMTSGLLFQQLALLQQQMTLLGSSLDGKLGRLETRFDNSQSRLEDKIVSVKGDIETVKDDVKNKIESRVVDKLCQLEKKLSCVDVTANVAPRTWHEIEGILGMLKTEIKADLKECLAYNARSISNSTDTIVIAVQDQMTEMNTWEEQKRLRFENITETVDKILSSNTVLSHLVDYKLSSLYNDLNNGFQKLQGSINNSSTVTHSAVRDLADMINMSQSISTQSTQACEKGMDQVEGNRVVIQLSGKSGLGVPYLCDSATDGGGWIIIQRRSSGTLNFYRKWQEYKDGFGNLTSDFWLGNKYIHDLTSRGKYELRVDLKYKDKTAFAHYSSFFIEDESKKYRLGLSGYDGTAGDDLKYHNGKSFSTYDSDNDSSISRNCAQVYSGAWWYNNCYNSNLNGKWNSAGNRAARWKQFSGSASVSYSEMKIRAL